MNEPCKVSVLVPVYGVEKYIGKCAESLFSQTYANLEYVFVDDCTPDKSMDVLELVLKKHPERRGQVRMIRHEKNRGLAAARNTAVGMASGEFVMHVDSDDWVETDIVEKCIVHQLKVNSDIVGCAHLRHEPNRVLELVEEFEGQGKELCRRILSFNAFHYVWGKLIRRSLYVDNNVKNIEGANVSEDLYSSAILAFNAETASYIKDPLYHYNCCNETSYCRAFSERSNRQDWINRKHLREYFSDKGEEYLEAMNYEHKRFAALTILRAASESGHRGYIREIRELAEKIGNINEKNLTISQSFVLSTRSYVLTRMYSVMLNKFLDLRRFVGSSFPSLRNSIKKMFPSKQEFAESRQVGCK